jgi:REP element-mobilizing transposase RayT
MPRTKRLKIKGEAGFYHIISRTVGQQYLLGNIEKENLLKIIKHYSGYFFVKVLGFCILDNHFHLLVKSEPESFYDDEEVVERIKKYAKRGRKRIDMDNLSRLGVQMYREKLENISEYIRSIKQSFSVWYNKENKRTGYFWGGRFKSVLLEEGNALLACQAYIELNPVRAGIVKYPEDYRWSSLSYRLGMGKRDDFLSFDEVYFDEEKSSDREILSAYRYLVYKAGNIKSLTLAELESGRLEPRKPSIPDEIYNFELKRQFILPKGELLLRRIRYFSDGLVIGSKGFIQKAYNRFGGDVILKKDRNAYQTGLGSRVLSLRKLKIPL